MCCQKIRPSARKSPENPQYTAHRKKAIHESHIIMRGVHGSPIHLKLYHEEHFDPVSLIEKIANHASRVKHYLNHASREKLRGPSDLYTRC